MYAECSARQEALKLLLGLGISTLRVNDEAHLVAACREFLCQVGDMAKQAADRRAHDLENAKRPFGRCQIHRSDTTIVSPGWMGKSNWTLPLTISLPWRR